MKLGTETARKEDCSGEAQGLSSDERLDSKHFFQIDNESAIFIILCDSDSYHCCDDRHRYAAYSS